MVAVSLSACQSGHEHTGGTLEYKRRSGLGLGAPRTVVEIFLPCCVHVHSRGC